MLPRFQRMLAKHVIMLTLSDTFTSGKAQLAESLSKNKKMKTLASATHKVQKRASSLMKRASSLPGQVFRTSPLSSSRKSHRDPKPTGTISAVRDALDDSRHSSISGDGLDDDAPPPPTGSRDSTPRGSPGSAR